MRLQVLVSPDASIRFLTTDLLTPDLYDDLRQRLGFYSVHQTSQFHYFVSTQEVK